MGENVVNHRPRPHYHIVTGALSRQGLAWNIHKGADQVDVDLSEITAAEWADLETEAATSQAAFNAEAANLWGTDYSGLSTPAKAGMRIVINGGLP